MGFYGVLENPITAGGILRDPVLNDNITWSVDQRRHTIRYVTEINRDAILKDFINKLETFNTT